MHFFYHYKKVTKQLKNLNTKRISCTSMIFVVAVVQLVACLTRFKGPHCFLEQ